MFISKHFVYICSVRFDTMTKVIKFQIPIDIHSNISATFDFIDENLPKKYSSEVYKLLPENKKYRQDYIRKVKNDRINNAVIINYLYVVAKNHHDNQMN